MDEVKHGFGGVTGEYPKSAPNWVGHCICGDSSQTVTYDEAWDWTVEHVMATPEFRELQRKMRAQTAMLN